MRLAVMLGLLLSLNGCGQLSYYAQAVGGQLEIWQREVQVEQLLADSSLGPELRLRLERVQRIRDFASRELGLPDNRSYRSYADLDRPFVVWNIVAAPEFSLQAKQWCFLFAGCVSYRGYFSEAQARTQATRLSAQGYDVHVGGVPAYSTLGWFPDPVLNTFIHYPEPELARLLFHELAHQLVYVQDDTVFNESFATVVEKAGVSRWLNMHGNAEQRQRFASAQAIRGEFLALLLQTRGALEKLYAADLQPAEKRRRKAEIFEKLRQDYQEKRKSWSGYSGFDRWFAQPLGNAHLASIALYTRRVPAFEALLAANDHDLPRFYAAVRTLAVLPLQERNARLDALEKN